MIEKILVHYNEEKICGLKMGRAFSLPGEVLQTRNVGASNVIEGVD